MAVPKSKVSRQRRDKRRSSVWKLNAPHIVKCPNCGAYHLPHRACKACAPASACWYAATSTFR